MEFVHQINKPKEYIQQIFDINTQRNIFSVYATGGGITSLQWLFTTAGASKCLKSGNIPYSRSALRQLIDEDGSEPIASFCSLETAKRLAEKAYQSTMEHVLREEAEILASSNTSNIFGVACTAALATSVPMRGDHRCYIALYSPKITITYSVVMDKEALSRDEEDIICSNFLLHLLGQHCQLPPYLSLGESEQKLFRYERTETRRNMSSLIEHSLDGRKSTVVFPSLPSLDSHSKADSQSDSDSWHAVQKCDLPAGALVFPGSYNPLHIGHLKLVQTAVAKLQSATPPSSSSSSSFSGLILFEIAAINVDKPPIAIEEIKRRLNQFFFQHHSEEFARWLREKKYVVGVAITTTPMFVQKSFLFPRSHFLIGADTLERLVDPKYYRDALTESDETLVTGKLIQSISTIHHNGCQFIIGGRVEQKKGVTSESAKPLQFQTLTSIIESSPIAKVISQLFPPLFFQQIDENEFRLDISSSQLRKAAENR